jgi:hypothetical protein
MAFPASPTNGQIHSIGDRSWSWNATLGAWKRLANSGTVNWQQYKYVRDETNYSYARNDTPYDVGLNLTITLGNASNKVLIDVRCHGCKITPATEYHWLILYRNGTEIARLARVTGDVPEMHSQYIDVPGSVGPHAYSVKAWIELLTSDPITGEMNLGTSIGSTLLIAEVKA